MAPNLLLGALLLLAAYTSGAKLESTTEEEVQWRLPTIIVPSLYRLHINVTEASLTEDSDEYWGMVVITINVTENTDRIQLHASHDHITFNLITLQNNDIDPSNYSVDPVTDILTVITPFGKWFGFLLGGSGANEIALGETSVYSQTFLRL